MKTAAELVVQVLADAGVKHVFGISGDSVLALMDAIERTPGISYMTVRHEQVGTSMADGYARVTGDPGVVLAHMGPGVCNLVIGLASAFRDSSPVIALTGVREGRKIGRDSWHEIDQLALLRPITKWNTRITSADTAARLMRTGVTLALSGRPGPVHLEVPKDIALVESKVEGGKTQPFEVVRQAARVAPNPALVAKACDLLLSAKRPVILAGGGVLRSRASEELMTFATMLPLPVITTNKGRSSIPEDHPLCVGPMGQYGTPFASEEAKQADVLLGLGCRFSDVTTRDWTLISPGTKIIHVDIDPKELGRQFEEELSMVGDVKSFLQAAMANINRREGVNLFKGRLEEHPRIAALVEGREAEREAYFQPSNHAAVPGKPHLLVKEISNLLKRDATITIGAGLYARFAGRLRVTEPRSCLKSLGLGALGWAFPAALGAKLGQPSRQVIALMGDADFMTVMQDLETAVRENIAVTIVIFNDFGHGSIRELQRRDFGGREVGSDSRDVPFGEFARIMGALGTRISKPEEVKAALGPMLDSGKPGLLEIAIDPKRS
jgi:acetolactate synthase-1/2/3 large subunit